MSSDGGRPALPTINTELEAQATGAVYQVIKEFNARLEDELTLRLGDKVEVISDDKEYNDGWYMGKSLSTGSVGLYPKAFTQLLPSLSRPSLLRSRSRRIASPTSGSLQSPISQKSAVGTPTSMRAPKFDDYAKNSPSIPEGSQLQPTKPSAVTRALSDIDKALEELRTEAGSEDIKTERRLSTDSKESLNPEGVESWSPEQVTSYFSYLGFDEQSSGQFAKHKITGAILLELELAYLKELDITSFGTRFEIYKEIEALRELVKPANMGANDEHQNGYGLQAAPELYKNDSKQNLEEDLDAFTRPLGHARKKSRSLDDIPESSKHQHPMSVPRSRVSMQPPSSQVPQPPASPLESQFLSPRRAPAPPSYPSPVEMSQSTPTMQRHSVYEGSASRGHSRKPSYDINPAYNMGHSRKSSHDISHSRVGSRGLKSASTADLLGHMNDARPASSIYMDATHSRSSSVNVANKGHTRNSSHASQAHRRHSSVFSFMSNGFGNSNNKTSRPASVIFTESPSKNGYNSSANNTPLINQRSSMSPTKDRRSVSAKESVNNGSAPPQSPSKRSVSEAVRAKTLRNISSSKNNKKETSAFMEGIKHTTPADSIKTADCFGWMAKRGGIAVGVWKQRYFTLHGTRLSYFSSLNDTKERGLIDITSHKVLPARDDDKLVSLYAASTGNGKFCFKLVPPAPGSRKGLTFTQPKVHYFAVETKEEMRTWMAALIKATIDIDESVPVLSSCATPTVSLQRAQVLLSQARETAKKREEARNNERHDLTSKPSLVTEFSGNSSGSPDTDSFDSNMPVHSPNTTANTSDMTPVLNHEHQFTSPYDLPLSTKSGNSSAAQSPVDAEFKSKPYNAGVLRQQSSRVLSTSQAAAQAALGVKKNGGKI